MLKRMLSGAPIGALALLAPLAGATALAQTQPLAGDYERDGHIRHVLLISIDGMHALDFANCAHGVNGGTTYCPNLNVLARTGVTYTQASRQNLPILFPASPRW